MSSRLYKDMDSPQKESFQHEVGKSVLYRKRLIEVLEQDIDVFHTAMRDDEAYGEDWAYRQAMLVGKVKATKALIALLK